MAKSICFFNNKGGVGKTTTSANVAASFAKTYGKKVLYIDLDPQCNSTLLVLGEQKVAESYWENPKGNTTIFDIIKPMLDDEPRINYDKGFINKTPNRFGVDLIMGHPRLASIEDRLGEAWVKVPGGDIGALRKTNWCSKLLYELDDSYDYIIMDLGPSLGSLNRSALIASDYFVTPMSIDIFSIVGLKNINDWFKEWGQRYKTGYSNIDPTRNDLDDYRIKNNVSVDNGCLGYTTQTYATRKNVQGERRPTKAYEKIIERFDEEFESNLGSLMFAGNDNASPMLGSIPNMFSIAPIAQNASSPIMDLKSSDGIFGAHYSQSKEFSKIFDKVASKILSRLENEQ